MTSISRDARPGESALVLWARLTGRPVEALSYGGDLDDFSLYKANKLILKAIDTGDEAIVTLLIRSQVPLYAKAIRFPLMEYRNGSARITAMLETMDALDALFCQAHIAKLHGEYLAYAEGALAFYRKIDPSKLTEATREFVATEGAGVGLDALGSLDKLTRLMIQDGVPAPATTAKLDRNIYQVSRIEDLMSHARQIPPGFSLCVIRGANVASSYFVMLVRTGNRILALTDK